MNYPASQDILNLVKESNRILINCHRSPDPDSLSSALSLAKVLKEMGKKDVFVISPDEPPYNCAFLPGYKDIIEADFDKFNFSDYDLFIIVDSGNWDQVTGKDAILLSGIKTVTIDHHFTNPGYGDLAILDMVSSTAEVLYRVFCDWEVKFDAELATILLTGITADTASFQAEQVNVKTFETACKLMENGADQGKVVFNLYRSRPIDEILLMGEMLARAQKDPEYSFVWSGIPKDIVAKYPQNHDAKVYIASFFMQSVVDTDFGFVIEEKDNFISVSFRSRTGFDVSQIAEELGGGGHKSAAAARIYKVTYEEGVNKILEAARKYAKRS